MCVQKRVNSLAGYTKQSRKDQGTNTATTRRPIRQIVLNRMAIRWVLRQIVLNKIAILGTVGRNSAQQVSCGSEFRTSRMTDPQGARGKDLIKSAPLSRVYLRIPIPPWSPLDVRRAAVLQLPYLQ